VLTVGGLFDAEDCWGAWNTYRAIERQNPPALSNRIVMGPWVHGGWARTGGLELGRVRFDQPTSAFYQSAIELPFFEYYLKDRGAMTLPDAYVFETGSNRWTTHDQWPPKAMRAVKYHFQPGGGLAEAAPAAGSAGYDEYVSDPAKPVPYTEDVHLRRTREYMVDDQRFAARRPDVLVYQTPVLTAPLTLAGPVTADLRVSTTGTDADFVVKLIDVFPDTLSTVVDDLPMGGYQMLVRGEIMRGRYRNSFERPEAFRPGEVTAVRFELPDVAHTFLPGHRLMIQVQSSWFPLADRNPQQFINIYQAKDEDFNKAAHRVYWGGQHPSGVVLPVME
jgi:putative CocE/NonD family hydrolase